MTPPLRRASYTLHVASIAGLDREGAKPFPVFQLELVRLLDQVLDLFDGEPRFQHLTLDGQVSLIEDYLSLRPEQFERVEQAVQDGKLLIGPWFTRPAGTGNSIEAIVRNLMIGLRTARVFGRPMLVGYLPDVAYLPGQLPQIFKSFAIEAAIIGRTASDQAVEVTWEGLDGTRIALGQTPRVLMASLDTLKNQRAELAPYSQAGHLFMQSRWSERPEMYRLLPEAQAQSQDAVFQSTPTAYAAALVSYARSNLLPVIHGDIDVPAPLDDLGKQIEAGEQALTRWIEPYAVLSENSLPGESMRLPRQLLQRLWRDLLGCAVVGDEAALRFNHIEVCAGFVMDNLSDSHVNLVHCSEPTFALTAIKPPEELDRAGMIVRGYNVSSEPFWVTLTPWRPFAAVDVVSMDEVPTGGKLATESNGAIRFRVGPHRILSFWFHD